MRIILYTGKGGVGKTSIAAATACKIASEGARVLIMSTDAAHSLGDSFDVKLGNTPTMIINNLYAMEIDTIIENEALWGNLKGYLVKLFASKGSSGIETEELLVFPGFEDLVSLIKIKEIYDQGEYDVLIVDCAPTGETMSLLKFPDLMGWWMKKFFPMKKKAARVARPVIEATTKIPIPDSESFEDIEKLYQRLEELNSLLLNKEVVSIRIVTTPEKIVIKEGKKSFSYLHLFDYNVDGIIVNKVFSEEGSKGYFEKWVDIQTESIRDIYESFSPIPVFQLELMSSEIRTYEKLEQVGKLIYGDTAPQDILYNKRIFEVKKSEQNGYDFIINMPFLDKKDLNMYHRGDELTVSVKNERRSFMLPTKLHSKEINKAIYSEGKLTINFI